MSWTLVRGMSLVAVLALGAVLAGAPLRAESPPTPQGPGVRPAPRPGLFAADEDEMSPELVLGPAHRLLRLWQRRPPDPKQSGSLMLAQAGDAESWKMLIHVQPPERGVTARDPALAVSPSGSMALVYRWWRDQPRAKHLRLARSDDGGATWTEAPTTVDDRGHAFSPRVLWGAQRTLVVAWADERHGRRGFEIYARRSPDGGATWAPEQILSHFPNSARTDFDWNPQLVGDGAGRFWLGWIGLHGGRSAVYVTRSTDDGRTWAPPVSVSGASESAYALRLRQAGERVLAVWQDTRSGRDRIYAAVSDDAGRSWRAEGLVGHLPAGGAVATEPAVLLTPAGEAIVAWQDTRNGRDDIYLARSRDGGATWEGHDQRVDADEAGTAFSRFPQLALSARDEVVVVWEDDRQGFEGIYLRVWAKDRQRWGPERLVVEPGTKTGRRLPRVLALPDGRVALAWEDWAYQPGATTPLKRVGSRVVALPTPE